MTKDMAAIVAAAADSRGIGYQGQLVSKDEMESPDDFKPSTALCHTLVLTRMTLLFYPFMGSHGNSRLT